MRNEDPAEWTNLLSDQTEGSTYMTSSGETKADPPSPVHLNIRTASNCDTLPLTTVKVIVTVTR